MMSKKHRKCCEFLPCPRARLPLVTRLALVTMLVVLTGTVSGRALAAGDEDHGGGHDHKNHVALFFGSTQAEEHHGEREDPSFTIGMDYERRLTKRFGVGVMADLVVEGNREFLFGIPLFLHAGKGAKLLAAPCVHKLKGDDEYDYVFRAGLVWDFNVGPGTLAPVVLYDIAEHHDVFVVGLGIGKGW